MELNIKMKKPRVFIVTGVLKSLNEKSLYRQNFPEKVWRREGVWFMVYSLPGVRQVRSLVFGVQCPDFVWISGVRCLKSDVQFVKRIQNIKFEAEKCSAQRENTQIYQYL